MGHRTRKGRKMEHNYERNRNTRDLARVNAKLRLDHTHTTNPQNLSPTVTAHLNRQRDHLLANLTALYSREQEINCHNFGIERETNGES